LNPDLSGLESELKRDPSSRRFGELAREYQRLGRLDEARDLCEKGLQKHPTQWQARLLLAQVYLAQGRLDDARGCVEKILLALPEHVQANHLAADIYLALGERPRALKHYQVVELFEPGRPGVARAIAALSAPPEAIAPPPVPAVPAAPPAAPPPEVPGGPASVPAPEPPPSEVVLSEPEAIASPVPAEEPTPAEVEGASPDAAPLGSESASRAEAAPIAEELAPPAVPPPPQDDFVGTIKIPTWTEEAVGPGASLLEEDVDQTAPAPVMDAGDESFSGFGEEGAGDQLGEEFLDAHEQTLTELPHSALPEPPAPAPPAEHPLPPAAHAEHVVETPALSTTTLAVLYAEQGYPEKAIEVYQRVLLQDPERADVKRKIQELMQRISGEAPEMPDVRQEDVRRALRQRRVQVLEGWLRRVREERHV